MDTNLCLSANQKLAQGSGVPCGSLRLWDCPGPGGGCSPRGTGRPPSLHTRSPPSPSCHHTSEAEDLGFSTAPDLPLLAPCASPGPTATSAPTQPVHAPAPALPITPELVREPPGAAPASPGKTPARPPSWPPQPPSQVLKLVLPAALRGGSRSLTSPAGPALFTGESSPRLVPARPGLSPGGLGTRGSRAQPPRPGTRSALTP